MFIFHFHSWKIYHLVLCSSLSIPESSFLLRYPSFIFIFDLWSCWWAGWVVRKCVMYDDAQGRRLVWPDGEWRGARDAAVRTQSLLSAQVSPHLRCWCWCCWCWMEFGRNPLSPLRWFPRNSPNSHTITANLQRALDIYIVTWGFWQSKTQGKGLLQRDAVTR